MYLVWYAGGGWDNEFTVELFVTKDKKLATDYVEKFNSILRKWQDYYRQFTDDGFLMDDYESKYFMRWDCLSEINGCYWREIEVR